MDAAGIALADVAEIVHGTTLVTNALIERRGARLGLITTRGFRDILEMGTEQRYDIYDLFLQFPEPLVPRRRRLEVAERMDRDGNVLTPLDPAEVRAVAQRLVAEGVEAIAVCFLHAYRNPAHEREAAAIMRARIPRHCGVDLVRCGGRDVGVPALRHHLRQRLRAAADEPLHRASWNASCTRAASAASSASCTRPAACCRRRPRATSRSACWKAVPRAAALPPRSSATSPARPT